MFKNPYLNVAKHFRKSNLIKAYILRNPFVRSLVSGVFFFRKQLLGYAEIMVSFKVCI